MSKTMILAFIESQFNMMSAQDNKERLHYIVAGIKDGELYDLSGNTYGKLDGIEDTEWITKEDGELSRITSAKIGKAKHAFKAFADKVLGVEQEDEPTVKQEDEPTVKQEDEPTVEDEIDIDAVVKACKKAIKKGNQKKAMKLANKIETVDVKAYKKLMKKIGDI